MRVSFIGMSNIGKSYWARRVTAIAGCRRIDCDALIERRLRPELEKGGFRGLRGMGQWMGLPDAPQHEANATLYREAEQEVMRECMSTLGKETDKSAVVDTTGSVIYTDDQTRAALRELTRIVYFEASDDHIDRLFRSYIANPKPTIWNGLYQPQDGETPRQTLQRCYPLLLQERARRYRELAHITVPFKQHRADDADMQALLQELGIVL